MLRSRAICFLIVLTAIIGLFADAHDENPVWPAMFVTGLIGWLMFDHQIRRAQRAMDEDGS